MRQASAAVLQTHAGRLLAGLGVGLALIALGAATGVPALLAMIALTAGGLLVAMKPVLGLGAAIFLLYTNLPVVAAARGPVPTAAAAIVPMLLALSMLHQLAIRRQPLVLDRTFHLMLAFLSVLLLGAFLAEGQDVALARIGVFASEGLLVYLLVRNSVRELPTLRVAIWTALAAAALLATFAVYQAVSGDYRQDFYGLAQRNLEFMDAPRPTLPSEMAMADRAGGPMAEPNRFAQVLLMVVPLALALFLNARRRRTAALAMLLGSLALTGMILTYSRGSFLTLVVLALLCVPLRLVRARHLTVAGLMVLLLVPLVAPAYVSRIASIGAVAELLRGTPEAPDPVTRGRTTEMLSALAVYMDHPVLGVGPGQYLPFYSVEYQSLPEIGLREIAVPRRAHDLYLEIAAETGTVGLAIFLAIPLLLLTDLLASGRRLWHRRPDHARLAAAFSLVILAYLGTGVFLHLAYERYYWLVVALTASAVGILSTTDDTPNPQAWR